MSSTDRADALGSVTIEVPAEHSALIAGEIWSELETKLEDLTRSVRSVEDIERVRRELDRFSEIVEQVPDDLGQPVRLTGPAEMFARIAVILFDYGADAIEHARTRVGLPESWEQAIAMADASQHVQLANVIVDQLRQQEGPR